jgi:hypothetical protein
VYVCPETTTVAVRVINFSPISPLAHVVAPAPPQEIVPLEIVNLSLEAPIAFVL